MYGCEINILKDFFQSATLDSKQTMNMLTAFFVLSPKMTHRVVCLQQQRTQIIIKSSPTTQFVLVAKKRNSGHNICTIDSFQCNVKDYITPTPCQCQKIKGFCFFFLYVLVDAWTGGVYLSMIGFNK